MAPSRHASPNTVNYRTQFNLSILSHGSSTSLEYNCYTA
ncbi:hypothetical protein C1A50_2212 [Paenibacillus polymyxa]|nr:hypothetical protein C1A50_2212 [Paenibacillus polymyxa]